jgi:hypothetical protein
MGRWLNTFSSMALTSDSHGFESLSIGLGIVVGKWVKNTVVPKQKVEQLKGWEILGSTVGLTDDKVLLLKMRP